MGEPSKVATQSDPNSAFVIKVFGSMLWLAVTVLWVTSRPLSGKTLLAAPFALLFAFNASLAQIRFRDGVLRYRRFFQWKTLPTARSF